MTIDYLPLKIGSKVSDPSTPQRTPNCTLLLFISNFWASGYFAVFQSQDYYYLVAGLDMQSKGHAICATLVSQSNVFSTMPRLNPVTVSQGSGGSNLVHKPQKMFFILIVRSPPINVIAKTKTGHIKTIILIWLQATQHFNVNGTRILNHYEAWFRAKKAHQKMIEYHFNG